MICDVFLLSFVYLSYWSYFIAKSDTNNVLISSKLKKKEFKASSLRCDHNKLCQDKVIIIYPKPI